MTPPRPYSGPLRKLVLAFDVGTTYSGIAYAILDPGEVPKIQGVTRRVLFHFEITIFLSLYCADSPARKTATSRYRLSSGTLGMEKYAWPALKRVILA